MRKQAASLPLLVEGSEARCVCPDDAISALRGISCRDPMIADHRHYPEFYRHRPVARHRSVHYLVDVRQRISDHPTSRVAELTLRLLKQHFAANPLRSDIHECRLESITPRIYRLRRSTLIAL
jgi:hypothetical protein